MVTAMDEAVAKVMTAMRKYKLTNNLLVVFSSDVSSPHIFSLNLALISEKQAMRYKNESMARIATITIID